MERGVRQIFRKVECPHANHARLIQSKYDKTDQIVHGKDLKWLESGMVRKGQWFFKVVTAADERPGATRRMVSTFLMEILRSLQDFNDFSLKLEGQRPEGNNSGVYLRGFYEFGSGLLWQGLDSHNMGAL